MNESMPDDIEILLDCLKSPEDLAQDEMEPLRNWIADTPDGELALSNAVAENTRLETALVESEIPIPKMLQRNVHAYLLENTRVEAEEVVAKHYKTKSRGDSRTPKNILRSVLQFSVGVAVGLAVLFYGGTYVLKMVEGFSVLDANELAENAEVWFENAQQKNDWGEIDSVDITRLPLEIKPHPIGATKLKTEFGETLVFELEYKPQARGQSAMLFVFESSRSMDDTSFSISPIRESDLGCVGVAKSGDTFYVLVVEGDRADYAALIQPRNTAVVTASIILLQFVRMLC